MLTSIFTNENFFNLSDPQPAWLYEVIFYKDSGDSYVENTHLFVDSITMPQFETEKVTKTYFGSEKSYPVVRKYGTDVDLEFTIRSDWNDNKQLFRISQINGRNLKSNTVYPVHPELEKYKDKSLTLTYTTVNKIEILLRPKAGIINYRSGNTGVKLTEQDVKSYSKYSKYTTGYVFYNCILTNFSFNSELNYESDDVLKCKLTFHSDIWEHKNNDVNYSK